MEKIILKPFIKFCFLIFFTASVVSGVCEDQVKSEANTTNSIVFREPFTLTLHVDKEHSYEEKIPKIPYVHKGSVYLFKGDSFGIDLDITNDTIRSVVYQADTNKAAVTLRFTQEVETNGEAMMMLVIKNNTDKKLFFDALMTVPERKNALKTSILPVGPGLSNYESWQYPIIQLVLRNIRFAKQAGRTRRVVQRKQTCLVPPNRFRHRE
jgi:hypothetical protein